MDACGPLLARLGPRLAGLTPPVVVACSGGADSVALLALSTAAGIGPVAVHVDHGARPGSSSEADHVAALAERLGARFHSESVRVPPGPGFEARAREARYGALEAARSLLGASTVLVAHTRDDQAETVLLNVLRGAALAGLAGMAEQRGTIRRPLLDVPRADLLAVCAALGLTWIDDPMNADVAHRRVWLRREVIPPLEAGADRDLRGVLARQAALVRADDEVLEDLAADAAAALGDPPDAAGLSALRPALVRRVVRRWLGPPPVSAEHTEAILQVASGSRRAVDLPGGDRIVRADGRLARLPGTAGGTGAEPVPVPLPGASAGFGVRLESWVERAAPVHWPDGRWTAVFDADQVGERACLRAPAPGERFQPLGMTGTKAVAEALRESGVPAESRPAHPVLARPSGETLWVLGYRIDHRVRVDRGTRRYLWVTAEAGGIRV
jgi:tRNA(Ile)-lysidine synthetase-like protein